MSSYTTNIPVNNTFNITAVFGQKGSLWKNGHKGVDITAENKTIYSICDGEVTVVGWDADGWGRYVSIAAVICMGFRVGFWQQTVARS